MIPRRGGRVTASTARRRHAGGISAHDVITDVTLTLGADPTDASRPYMGLTLVGYLFFFIPPQGGTPPAHTEQQPGV
jgi:hypothetical protein